MPIPSANNFAAILEARASEPQDFVCFLESETGLRCTYFELRLRGVWLAREMEAQGIVRGGVCAIDMENSPALLYAVVAAAYGGFSLLMLNTRLSAEEKQERIDEAKRALQLNHLPLLDEKTAMALVREADQSGRNARGALNQWAHKGVGAFDTFSTAVIMFTSGTSGKPKAAPLSWENLLGAARASNEVLNTEGEGIWQLVLPMYHVGGLAIFIRSVLNHNAFLLYRTFSAHAVLQDAYTYGATHISVVDKMLQDLLAAETESVQDSKSAVSTTDESAEPPQLAEASATVETAEAAEARQGIEVFEAQLSSYDCILLGGSKPNKATLARALGQHAPIYISYGLTETSSQLANARVTNSENIWLNPLPGYSFSVAAPDSSGYGRLAVKGPGVISNYLNAQAAFTVDGYFLTGDMARMENGQIEIAERFSDMFVSGGENIYPAEIRDKIFSIESVTDAYVFGAPDATWGRRPVAFVEASASASRPGHNAFFFADDMRNRLSTRLSSLNMPDQFVVMNEFPRSGIGKTSTGTLERMWEARLHVAKVEIWQLRLPLVQPIRTAKTKLKDRECALVRLTDWAGRTGIGECVAFASNWYMAETLDQDLALLRNKLAPLLVGRVLLRPSQAGELFENVAEAAQHPLACAALENALWDLYGKVRQRSVRQLIGARETATEVGALNALPSGYVFGGAVVGVGNAAETLAAVRAAEEAGYTRVKLKIKPGSDVNIVQEVRKNFPHLRLMLDANQSYKDEQIGLLQQLDEFDIECIEEPLDPSYTPSVGPTNLFDRLARLQTQLRMRVCLDESWENAEQLMEVLDAHPELRCVALKIGKFGGVGPALEFHKWARERGIEAWPGGMYETGVSKRLHAAFALLPGVNMVGDISSSSRYFTADVCTPAFQLEGGILQVNPDTHPYGIGCELNESALSKLQTNYWVCA